MQKSPNNPKSCPWQACRRSWDAQQCYDVGPDRQFKSALTKPSDHSSPNGSAETGSACTQRCIRRNTYPRHLSTKTSLTFFCLLLILSPLSRFLSVNILINAKYQEFQIAAMMPQLLHRPSMHSSQLWVLHGATFRSTCLNLP